MAIPQQISQFHLKCNNTSNYMTNLNLTFANLCTTMTMIKSYVYNCGINWKRGLKQGREAVQHFPVQWKFTKASKQC